MKGCHVRLFGVLTCRVIRFILARLIIDSNHWLLISYKQWLFHELSSLVISMKQIMRLGCGNMILLIMMLMELLIMMQVQMLLMIMIYLLVNLIMFSIVETLS